MASETINQRLANKKATAVNVRKSTRVVDVWNDLLTDDDRAEFEKIAEIERLSKYHLDGIDVLCAEFIEYLGWDGYAAFEAGDVSLEQAKKLVAAVKYVRLADSSLPISLNINLATIPVAKRPKEPIRRAQSLLNKELRKFEVTNG